MAKKISFSATLAAIFLIAGIAFTFYLFSGPHATGDSPSLFGIPLIPPIFAQGGPANFPDPDAGLSSYIQRDPSLIDFTKIIPVFDETIDGGENYLIGSINSSRTEIGGTPTPTPIHVRVYIDKDGFIIAYLTKDKLVADAFRWYFSDPPADPLDTVLSDALAAVTTAIGAPAPTDTSWYHWNYPSATHFSAAAKKGVGNMYMRIPAGAIFSESPSYSWHSNRQSQGTSGTLNLHTPEGTQTTLENPLNTQAFSVQKLPPITPGPRYTFEIKNGAGGVPQNHFLGVVVVYRIP